jgi:hypothetical protein
MVSDDKIEELKHEMLRRMYNEAEPSLDWDDLVENPDDYEDWNPDNHELPKEKQDEITEEVLEEHGVDEGELPPGFWLDVITDKSPRNP